MFSRPTSKAIKQYEWKKRLINCTLHQKPIKITSYILEKIYIKEFVSKVYKKVNG